MTNIQKRLFALVAPIIQPPLPADPAQARLARQLYYLLLLGIPIAFSFVLFDVEVRSGQWDWRDLIPGGSGIVLIGLLLLVRRGYLQLATICMILLPLIAISLASFTKMGIRNPALMVIPLLLMLSSLFLFTMMALTVWGDRGLLAMWRTQRDLDRLVREIEIIDQKNASLVRDMQRLRTDRDYIEKIAREELGLVRAGEIMFEFSD